MIITKTAQKMKDNFTRPTMKINRYKSIIFIIQYHNMIYVYITTQLIRKSFIRKLTMIYYNNIMELCNLTYIHIGCIITYYYFSYARLKFFFYFSYAHDDLDNCRTTRKRDCSAVKGASENS